MCTAFHIGTIYARHQANHQPRCAQTVTLPTLIMLTQKLFMPTLPTKRVERGFLLYRLDAGLAAGRSMTLISAPAGYGKSTLAAMALCWP